MSTSDRTREHHITAKQGALCPDPSQLFAAAASAFPFGSFGAGAASGATSTSHWMEIQRALVAAQSKLFQPQHASPTRHSPAPPPPMMTPTSRSESQQQQ